MAAWGSALSPFLVATVQDTPINTMLGASTYACVVDYKGASTRSVVGGVDTSDLYAVCMLICLQQTYLDADAEDHHAVCSRQCSSA